VKKTKIMIFFDRYFQILGSTEHIDFNTSGKSLIQNAIRYDPRNNKNVMEALAARKIVMNF